ncbi:aminoacyltransferase [Candidatus Saccharibacteria bacterium]|nr:aminoacyltransferase [Candidatus Saccharibacteria bacterium]
MKRTFSELSKEEWREFLAGQKTTHIFQSVERIELREMMGYQNYIVGLREGGRVVAGGVLLGRRGEFWMAYGPLIDWDNHDLVAVFLSGLVDFSRAKNMLKIEVFPDVLLSLRDSKGQILEQWDRSSIKQVFREANFRYQGETIGYEMKAGRWAFTKDLSGIKDVDALRKTYRKTLRARLRQTENDVKITTLKRDELGVLVGLIDESDARHGVSGRQAEYYEQMYDALGRHVKFLVARKTSDNKPIAGAVFVDSGREMASYLSGMDRRYRELNGRAWLQDFMMRECLKKGIPKVNFFWIEGRFADNPLLEFKSGFGGVVEEYIGGFEKIISPAKYYSLKVGRKIGRVLRQIPRRQGHRN